MAIRVLGYKTVVEAKGTWPTNYIAKAEELDLLEDITYGTYAAGAARGNVALLIWNMLRTNMWDVDSESEGDGLTYRDTMKSMLNTKFKDFKYSYAMFSSFSTTDGEITVTLSRSNSHGDSVAADDWELGSMDLTFDYAKTDFYTFVPGTEVEVLVNTKDDTLLSMVKTDRYNTFAGSKVEIDDKYDENNFSGDVYVYAYMLLDGKDVLNKVEITATSEYIYDLDTSSTKRVKFNGTKGDSLNFKEYEDAIIIKDGEFATVKDLEVGDVWTIIYLNGSRTPAFYMIAGAEGEGKLTKLVEKEWEAKDYTVEDTYYVATIDGEEINVAGEAVYFEDAEDVDDSEEATLIDASTPYEKMKNEVVTYVTDVFGRIVAVMFDGELNKGGEDEGAGESKFYALTSRIERDGSTYSITVENENGEETLTFAKNAGNDAWKNDEDLTGYFVIMTLNDDEEIERLSGDYSGEELRFVLRASGDAQANIDAATGVNGIELMYDEEEHTYAVSGEASVEYDAGKLLVGGNTWAKVNDDTVVVVLVYDDMGTTKTTDDEYRVEFKGIEALEGMKNDPAIAITDTANSKFARAKYVVIFDEVSSREDDLVGLVKDVSVNKLGDDIITIVEDRDDDIKDGTEYILMGTDSKVADIKANYQLVLYSIEENKDGEWELTVEAGITNDMIKSGDAAELDHAYIDESGKDEASNVSDDGREANLVVADDALKTALVAAKVITAEGKLDLDDEDTVKALEDARVFVVNVVLDEDEDPTGTQFYVDNYTEIEYSDIKLKELDRISLLTDASYDVEGIVIIRGMEAR